MKINIKKAISKIINGYYIVRKYFYYTHNLVVNNKYSNMLKELFGIGMNIPTYMYCDKTFNYISSISNGKTPEGKNYTLVSTTALLEYAFNFQTYNRFSKWLYLRKVNKFMENNETIETFRYKRILSLNVEVTGFPSSIL